MGPKPTSSDSHNGVGGLGFCARMETLCLVSRVSRSSVANDGRCVEKFVAVSGPDAAVTAFLVTPVMESAVLLMLTTLSLDTCWRKTL